MKVVSKQRVEMGSDLVRVGVSWKTTESSRVFAFIAAKDPILGPKDRAFFDFNGDFYWMREKKEAAVRGAASGKKSDALFTRTLH